MTNEFILRMSKILSPRMLHKLPTMNRYNEQISSFAAAVFFWGCKRNYDETTFSLQFCFLFMVFFFPWNLFTTFSRFLFLFIWVSQINEKLLINMNNSCSRKDFSSWLFTRIKFDKLCYCLKGDNRQVLYLHFCPLFSL